MIEIRATYSCRKGTAPCTRCPQDSQNVDAIVTYGKQPTLESAEELLYKNFFVQEMEIQNEKYRRKGNHGRIMDIDEFRVSPKHRPVENLLQIGNMQWHPPLEILWSCYREFFRWRINAYPDLLSFIGAVVFSNGKVPHIHERLVFYWTDENGVRHTGIDAALQKSGVERPFLKMDESRTNNRKITFDAISRENWWRIVEYKLRDSYTDVKLIRSEQKPKPIIKLDRSIRLELGSSRALKNSQSRQQAKIEGLTKKLNDLKEKQQAFQSEMPAEDISKERKSEILITKGKIKTYEKRLESAQKKAESIRANLNNRR